MNKEITIFGLGAIGSNVAYNLLQSEPRLILNGVDKDIVEQRNLGNQIYSQAFIGQSKVDAFVAEVYMRTQTMPKGKFVREEISIKKGASSNLLIKQAGLVLDAFDNFPSRDIVHDLSLTANRVVVHLGFGIIDKSLFGTIQWNDAYQTGQTDVENQDVCQISDATWWIKGVAAIMTKNILDFLRDGKQRSLIIKPDLVAKDL